MIFLTRGAGALAALLVATSLSAFGGLADDMAQMKSGQGQTFDGTGHPKAQGVALQLSYPKTWINEEGGQPPVLQKFTSEGGAGLVSLMIGSSPLPPETANRSGTLLTPAETRTMIPKGCQSVKLSSTTFNGLPVSTVEYTMEETPKLLLQRGQIFYLLTEGQLIILHGMAAKPADQPLKAFDAEWETAKALFRSIGGTLKAVSKKQLSTQ